MFDHARRFFMGKVQEPPTTIQKVNRNSAHLIEGMVGQQKFCIARTSDPNWIILHSTKQILLSDNMVYATLHYPNSQPDCQNEFTRTLWKIPGIVSMSMGRYELRIKRGKLYLWPEILPHIKTATIGWLKQNR